MLKNIVNINKQKHISLKIARLIAKKRVVIKRPKYAPFLENIKASYIINANNYRFDIYLPLT